MNLELTPFVTPQLFLPALAAACALYLVWGVKLLPGERWQIAAAIPLRRGAEGNWQGVNLTWYGILTANAYLVAVIIALILMGAAGISVGFTMVLVGLLLGCCVPASRLVAQIVEKKANTFTVGGAVFVGTILAPWMVELANRIPVVRQAAPVPPLAALAAISIAYAFGEGLGRLACISFGCCYGKPISACHPVLGRLAAPFAFTFTGKTKKACYASGLEGVKVLPVQGVTYLLYTVIGHCCIYLYLAGAYGAAFLLSLTVTQGWRVVSEFFRDDYRGGGRVSAYQVMGVVGVIYGVWTVQHFTGTPGQLPLLSRGISSLWHPAPLLLLQLLWLAILLYTGLSRVTGATIDFHVSHDKI